VAPLLTRKKGVYYKLAGCLCYYEVISVKKLVSNDKTIFTATKKRKSQYELKILKNLYENEMQEN
jgi:hypothetical protein